MHMFIRVYVLIGMGEAIVYRTVVLGSLAMNISFEHLLSYRYKSRTDNVFSDVELSVKFPLKGKGLQVHGLEKTRVES